MKLEDVQDKIDKYFEALTPEETIKLFESWGYELEDYQEIQDLTPLEKIKSVQDNFINKNNDPNSFIGCLGSKEWFDYFRFVVFLSEITFSFSFLAIAQKSFDSLNEFANAVGNLCNTTKITTTTLEKAFKDIGIMHEKISENDLILSKTPKIWEQKNKREMYKRGRK